MTLPTHPTDGGDSVRCTLAAILFQGGEPAQLTLSHRAAGWAWVTPLRQYWWCQWAASLTGTEAWGKWHWALCGSGQCQHILLEIGAIVTGVSSMLGSHRWVSIKPLPLRKSHLAAEEQYQRQSYSQTILDNSRVDNRCACHLKHLWLSSMGSVLGRIWQASERSAPSGSDPVIQTVCSFFPPPRILLFFYYENFQTHRNTENHIKDS